MKLPQIVSVNGWIVFRNTRKNVVSFIGKDIGTKKIAVILPQEEKIKWSYPLVTDLFYPQGGNAEYTKVWVTENQGVLLPTEQCVNIDLRYIKYVLEPIFRRRKKGREDGTYDIDKQRELADKYEQIEEIKESLINRITELTEIVVV